VQRTAKTRKRANLLFFLLRPALSLFFAIRAFFSFALASAKA
jgi:hypothetical protein